MKNSFDIGIVGSGPAGMGAAIAISRMAPHLRVVIFEKGANRFNVPASEANVTEGWGGAGAFSDGKFNLDATGRVGGQLVPNGFMSQDRWDHLLRSSAALYTEFGGNADRQFGHTDSETEGRVEELRRIGRGHRLELHRFPILHLGTSTATTIVENWRLELERLGVTTITDCYVREFEACGDSWKLKTDQGEFQVKKVIACPGRSGSQWFQEVAKGLGIVMDNNGIDIGVRVETSNDIMSELIRLFYEAKLYFRVHENDDRLRTFCMCPGGRVAIEVYRDTGILCANGHTDDAEQTANCNFAVLQTQTFTEPFNDPHGYGSNIARLCNAVGEGILVQRLGDLQRHRRSTPARMLEGMVAATCTDARVTPGDIATVLPARFLHGILSMLKALDSVAPGIAGPDTLLYLPEIKWNAVRARADATRGYEALPGFHVAGDGTGYTRGLNGATIHGMDVGLWVAQAMGGADISTYRDKMVNQGAWDRLFKQ